MKATSTIITILLVSILISAGLFIGSITGQVIKGELEELTSIELAIILSAIILCAELAILSAKRKRKEVDIKEMLKEARQGTY